MPGKSYAGRHRAGRHRAPSRAARATGALVVGGTGCAVGVIVLAVTAAAGPAEPSTGAAAAPAVLTVAEQVQEARQEKLQAFAADQRQAVRASETLRVSRSRARATAKVKKEREKAAALRRARAWMAPLQNYTLTSGFGPRWGSQHEGLDLAAPTGTRIGAISSGTVIFAGVQSGYGNKVEVRHWDGTVSYYAHMSSIAVRVGQQLAPGDKVGEVGNTGRSTGPHLHLQVLPTGTAVDGYSWLAARGVRL